MRKKMTDEERKAKKAALSKAYRQANKEEIATKQKAWRESNKESEATRSKAWQGIHKEEIAIYSKAWGKANKEKLSTNKKVYRVTINGLVATIYDHQKLHSKEREHQPPTYSRKELHVWMIAQSNFEELYSNWIASDCETNLRPSVDRLINSKGYSFDNIQLMTWKENRLKR